MFVDIEIRQTVFFEIDEYHEQAWIEFENHCQQRELNNYTIRNYKLAKDTILKQNILLNDSNIKRAFEDFNSRSDIKKK